MKKENISINSNDFFKIFDSLDDAIYIADKNGTTLWMNKTSKESFEGIDIIGKNVKELEKEKVFQPSVIKNVIETGERITKVQTLLNGKKHMTTGHIIFDEQGKSKYVIAHGRDMSKLASSTPQFEFEEINALLNRYIQEFRKLNLHQLFTQQEHPFIEQSPASIRLSQIIETVASVETTVLITGETGVGKNVAAQKIHQLSERHNGPFIYVNCAAIPETLIESELFGYQKGAFTGANTQGKAGLVKIAETGTLFLDEISELSLPLQSKLLQLLQDKTYRPIGAAQTQKANIRIIAATNLDLEEMVAEGTFRSDLFYRLNILPVAIIPLRERKEDIFPLLHFYLTRFNGLHKRARFFSNEVIGILQNYQWPGNIRELENLVEQLVILAKQDEILSADLPEKYKQNTKQNIDPLLALNLSEESLQDILDKVEKEVILQAYNHHKTTRKAAKALGISQSSLMRRLKKYKG
ncbi:transcriptional regulator [Bacillus sp. FJAT-27231]|uniref:sigma-54 interaction domain-containing protein n=1 Tax=Bacillus sp. FJAT-27231 TaxID=1679168 RepID=UPI0006713367|nr:sigma 54-interacting transcriptional regulator [Bacillus sp. FJAT-27231]KMY54189.1 transcriptional regulator [Bacillus sp. FJAT-27231]